MSIRDGFRATDARVSTPDGGPKFTIVNVERRVLTYAVTEAELDNLSLLSNGASIFYALGVAFLGYPLDYAREWLLSDAPGGCLCALLMSVPAAIFFAIGGVVSWRRRGVSRKLKVQR